ncbi:hypothetical protein H4R35_003915 [Dimargaris xerosporica]|nr:hypothetical protein H4R35_003915 [Dimargaris xerosporica]
MSALDSVTTALSQYMLKGWVLTDTECPNDCGVPLVRTKDSSQSVCVRCAANPTPTSHETGHNHLTGSSTRSHETDCEPNLKHTTSAQPDKDRLDQRTGLVDGSLPKPEALHAAATVAHRAKCDEIAQLIGDRLLAGWTLLGEYCPSPACKTTPLIRLRKGPRYCVSCGSTILTEAEYNAQRSANCAENGNRHPAHPQLPSLARANDSTVSPTIKPREPAPAGVPAPSLLHAATTDLPRSSDAQTAVHVAIAAVSQRLALLAQTMGHTTDAAAIAATASAMTECARALEQLTLTARRL